MTIYSNKLFRFWRKTLLRTFCYTGFLTLTMQAMAAIVEDKPEQTTTEPLEEILYTSAGDGPTLAYPQDNDADYYYEGHPQALSRTGAILYPEDNDQAYYWYYYDETETDNHLRQSAPTLPGRVALSALQGE